MIFEAEEPFAAASQQPDKKPQCIAYGNNVRAEDEMFRLVVAVVMVFVVAEELAEEFVFRRRR